ncbi:MAG: hypothetical protein NWQ54_18260 [Paraglaciecola sp.]|nr:hypothetical protein [Paraglaciecola sp.]
MSAHWPAGLTFTQTIRAAYSMNLNYYLQNPNSVPRFSVDLAHMPDDQKGNGFFNSDGTKNRVWLSAAYAF